MKKTKPKSLEYYMSLDYPFTAELYEEDGEVRFGMEIPDLPGVWADGKTLEEGYASLVESKKLWFEVRLKKGMDIPEPFLQHDYSGKFILRPGPRLHMELSKGAKRAKKSLNQHICSLLENQVSNSQLMSEIKKLVKIVAEQSKGIARCEKELRIIKHRMASLEEAYSSTSEVKWTRVPVTVWQHTEPFGTITLDEQVSGVSYPAYWPDNVILVSSNE